LSINQLNFDFFGKLCGNHLPQTDNAITRLAESSNPTARGAIFTRPEVVDFILDLAGYTTDQPLHQKRLLEPSFGAGDFLLPAVSRLLTAWQITEGTGSVQDELGDAIRAVELHQETFQAQYVFQGLIPATVRARNVERLRRVS
jgi:hypothetical protein